MKGNAMPRFTPPVRWVGNEFLGQGNAYRLYQHAISMSVIWRNGHYQEIRVVDDAGLVEGDTWFPGGRTHEVTDDQATLLMADGFEVEDLILGYGQGGYGDGPYGR